MCSIVPIEESGRCVDERNGPICSTSSPVGEYLNPSRRGVEKLAATALVADKVNTADVTFGRGKKGRPQQHARCTINTPQYGYGCGESDIKKCPPKADPQSPTLCETIAAFVDEYNEATAFAAQLSLPEKSAQSKEYLLTTRSRPALKSALRTGASNLSPTRRRGTAVPTSSGTERRVRGLWNPHCLCLFSLFQDDIMVDRIFPFLAFEDKMTASMVARRWRHCVGHPHTWSNVDASSYVSKLYEAQLQKWRDGGDDGSSDAPPNAATFGVGTDQADAVAARTSARFIDNLTHHRVDIRSLAVRSIEHRLSADVAVMGIGACLSTGRLRELTLTSYAALTDSLVNLMLLSQAVAGGGRGVTSGGGVSSSSSALICNRYQRNKSDRALRGEASKVFGGGRCSLSVLRLEQCPRLTDNVFRSIVANCHNLAELSLRGNHGITDSGLLALGPLVQMTSPILSSSPAVRSTLTGRSTSDIAQENTKAAGFFQPQSNKASLQSLFSPPPTTSYDNRSPLDPVSPVSSHSSALLSSFSFEPADRATGRSPRVTPGSLLPLFTPSLSVASSARGVSGHSRQLSSLDLSHTRVTANGIINLFRNVSITNDNQKIFMKRLVMNGSGEGWTDDLFRQLSNLTSSEAIAELDIGCANVFVGSSNVTDNGLLAISSHGVQMGLESVRLSGHRSITGFGVAEVLNASSKLTNLDLGGCTGLFSRAHLCSSMNNNNFEQTAESTTAVDVLAKALQGTGRAGLKDLRLWRCFMSKKEALSKQDLFEIEAAAGAVIVNSLSHGTSAETLKELDMDGCYFVDKEMVKLVRDRCVRLRTLRTRGTIYSG